MNIFLECYSSSVIFARDITIMTSVLNFVNCQSETCIQYIAYFDWMILK